MWFRPRNQQNDNDRFRVPSIRNKIRHRKSSTKNPVVDVENNEKSAIQSTAVASSRRRDDMAVLRSQSARRLSLLLSDEDESGKEKDKVLRTDHKYKKNRVTKSSSRTKIPDLKVEKSNSGSSANVSTSNARKLSDPNDATKAAVKVKTPRRNTNLNLNALLRYKSFISGSTKKLTSDDFDRMRRKSLGEINKSRRKSNPDNEPKDNNTEQQSIVIDANKQCQIRLETCDSDNLSDSAFQSCDETDNNTLNEKLSSRKSSPSMLSSLWFESTNSTDKQQNKNQKNNKNKNRLKGL